MSITSRIIDSIIYDIEDRRDLGNAWEEIDYDTKCEITKEWTQIINDHLKVAFLEMLEE